MCGGNWMKALERKEDEKFKCLLISTIISSIQLLLMVFASLFPASFAY